MKILYVLSSSVMGGATLSFLTMLEGVKVKGNEVCVVVSDMNEHFKDKLEELAVPFFVFPIPFSVYPNHSTLNEKLLFFIKLFYHYFQSIIAIGRLLKIVKQFKPNIIHTNVGPITIGYKVSKILKIPHVWHIREYQDKDFGMQFFPRKKTFLNYLQNSYSICITRNISNYFSLEKNSHSVVIYNGVCSKTTSLLCGEKELFFITASRISPEKGLCEIIDGFVDFHKSHENYKLYILGDGEDSYKEYLRKHVESLGYTNFIVFKGYTTDVMSYMNKAKALIVASKNEGFGRMTAEACCANCMVIGFDNAGTKEIIEKTGGLLYKSKDEMKECMNLIASMPENLYQEKVLKAQKVALDLYSTESYVDSIINFYNQILK